MTVYVHVQPLYKLQLMYDSVHHSDGVSLKAYQTLCLSTTPASDVMHTRYKRNHVCILRPMYQLEHQGVTPVPVFTKGLGQGLGLNNIIRVSNLSLKSCLSPFVNTAPDTAEACVYLSPLDQL